jgi:hypothetical protein
VTSKFSRHMLMTQRTQIVPPRRSRCVLDKTVAAGTTGAAVASLGDMVDGSQQWGIDEALTTALGLR